MRFSIVVVHHIRQFKKFKLLSLKLVGARIPEQPNDAQRAPTNLCYYITRMAHQRGHKDTYRVPPAASGFEWIGGLASKLAQKTLGLNTSVKQSGGYITDPQNENMRRGIANNTTFSDNRGGSYDRSGQPGGGRFVKIVPTFPKPQPIKNMPPQLAGYTDYARNEESARTGGKVQQNTSGRRINVQGKPAVGISIQDIKSAQDFFNTKSVYVNPLFKDKYDKIGNDPDSSDRSRQPLIVPRDRQATLRAMSTGVNEWAQAASKYFDKPFVVGKSPNYSLGSPLTTNVNIYGAEVGEAYTGAVTLGGSQTPGLKKAKNVLKAPGGENKITRAKALHKIMTLNTDLNPYDYGMTAGQWAATTTHEFGHTMGLGHSHNDPQGTTLNSEMSYDAQDERATILPATLNAYRNVINMNLGFTGAEKLQKKRNKQDDFFNNLGFLNQYKYNKSR